MSEAAMGPSTQDPLDPDWQVWFVKSALTEAGYREPDVWHEDGPIFAEHCGDCDCPNGGRDDDCGPPLAAVDKAFDLLNVTVTRLVSAGSNGSTSDGGA